MGTGLEMNQIEIEVVDPTVEMAVDAASASR
jgi:hypothetical protein